MLIFYFYDDIIKEMEKKYIRKEMKKVYIPLS